MVTDEHVRLLMKLNQTEKNLRVAAAKARMSENTARKYIKLNRLPSQCKPDRYWRTREDPFEGVWEEVTAMLEKHPGLEAKTIFGYLQRKYPDEFHDGQLRTLQRKIKHWRASEGPAREVYFPQKHHPGELSASDFTSMKDLGVTICRQPFDHLLYHFVLTYSNWETGTVCFSESLESFSEGLQNALWELGGVPRSHRTDRLSAAINNLQEKADFTRRYNSIMRHYGFSGQKTQPASPHENGDAEQRHHRIKRALDQALMLRGSRDFSSRSAYEKYLKKLFQDLNRGRCERFLEEQKKLRQLPKKRLEDSRKVELRVGPGSTINVLHNVYSVHSRLIGEKVTVRIHAENLDLKHGGKTIDRFPRIRGEYKHRINYRHVIDWLVRKPGAFKNYRYRECMFPSSRFRMAYDRLEKEEGARGASEYLKILHLAAMKTEEGVDRALRLLIDKGRSISLEAVKELISSDTPLPAPSEVSVDSPDIQQYDKLIEGVA